MQVTPNLGMTIPSSDADPFDELVFSTALTVIDTWSAKPADLTKVTVQTFAGPIQAPTPDAGDNSTRVATTAFVKNQGYLTSFNGRTAQAVVPTAGDYTAAMVTNAADKSTGTVQQFTGRISAPSFTSWAQTGASGAGGTLTPNTVTGQLFSFELTGNGSLTIAAPLNPPATTTTQWLALLLTNDPGNTTSSLIWNAVYNFQTIAKPTSLAAGTTIMLLFVWSYSSWYCVGKY